MVIIISAYCFNNVYLKSKHAQIIQFENTDSEKNLINFKKLMIGTLVIVFVLAVATAIQNSVVDSAQLYIPSLLLCCMLTFLNIYFTKNKYVLDHMKRIIKNNIANFEFSFLYSVYTKCIRTKRVSPSP